ncbi:hypothetical protein [Candidatus Uabimicrobium sp. HlEnr_7]|uniref:hypothetical protein n=1 Tax=Candidatus Uabimicrobium helgolandensis TaxID=3095367 RepID=UPI0035588327
MFIISIYPIQYIIIDSKTLTRIKICPKTIWNWSQIFENKASEIMEYETLLLDSKLGLSVEKLDPQISNLPLAIGGDGVFVSFRPNECSPDGLIWTEYFYIRLSSHEYDVVVYQLLLVRRP